MILKEAYCNQHRLDPKPNLTSKRSELNISTNLIPLGFELALSETLELKNEPRGYLRQFYRADMSVCIGDP